MIQSHISGRETKFINHYRWIISSILFGSIVDKRCTSSSYINLNYDLLREVVSKRHCRTFLTNLIKWGIIESDGKWSRGNKSTGYRLTEPYRSCKHEYVMNTDKRMQSKIDQIADAKDQDILGRKGYRECYYWLRELRINTKAAMGSISHLDQNSDKYKSRHQAITTIASGSWFNTIDRTAGRFHTNLSSLPSDLRPYIHFKHHSEHPVKQVDIVNSQPLLFHLTLSSSPLIDPKEKEEMANIVMDGRFYEAFNEEGKERDKFKREFFRDVLFGPGDYETNVTKLFASRFPSYDRLIKRMKSSDYKSLAIAMQKEEAKVIYQAVDRFARETRHQAPILTIHDSLVTTEPYAHIADQVLKMTFLELYGVIPTTTIK